LMHRRASIFSFMGLTSESTTSAERAEMYVGPGQSVRAVSGRDEKKKRRGSVLGLSVGMGRGRVQTRMGLATSSLTQLFRDQASRSLWPRTRVGISRPPTTEARTLGRPSPRSPWPARLRYVPECAV
jgi:hypothetical protein